MESSFTLILDTKPPANPTLTINHGAAVTGTQEVWVQLSTSDFEGGANDVSQVKLWGDVDPGADPAFRTEEVDAQWVIFSEQVALILSSGDEPKRIYGRLRDDVGNETVSFFGTIRLDTSVPVVTVTVAPQRSRISKVAPADEVSFSWESSLPFVAYQVRVVPSHGSPVSAGVLIGAAGGSEHTFGEGDFAALTPRTTTIRGADLEAASPGDTVKHIKVFVQSDEGVWSA